MLFHLDIVYTILIHFTVNLTCGNRKEISASYVPLYKMLSGHIDVKHISKVKRSSTEVLA